MEPARGKRPTSDPPSTETRTSKRLRQPTKDPVSVKAETPRNAPPTTEAWRTLLEARAARQQPKRIIAMSSQNVAAVWAPNPKRSPGLADQPLIAFMILAPAVNQSIKQSPHRWTFTLPPKTTTALPPNTLPAIVDSLSFSPDGAHLFVASRLAGPDPDQSPLRLTILAQGATADAWRVIWDEAVFNGPAGSINGEVIAKRVVSADFFGRQRKWIFPTPPGRDKKKEEDGSDLLAYREPTRGIDAACSSRGVTLLAVLNTREILLVHIPLDPKTPPHILVAPFPSHQSGLALSPTPSSSLEAALVTAIAEQAAPPATAPADDNLGLNLALGSNTGGNGAVDVETAAAALLPQGGTGLTPLASGLSTGLTPVATASNELAAVGDALMPPGTVTPGPPRETGVEVSHAAIGRPAGTDPCILIVTRERKIRPIPTAPAATELPAQAATADQEMNAAPADPLDSLNSLGSSGSMYGNEDAYDLNIDEAFLSMMAAEESAGDAGNDGDKSKTDDAGGKDGSGEGEAPKSKPPRHLEPREEDEDAVLRVSKVTLDFTKGAMPVVSLEPLPSVPFLLDDDQDSTSPLSYQDVSSPLSHLFFAHTAPRTTSPVMVSGFEMPAAQSLNLVAAFEWGMILAWNVSLEAVELSSAFTGLDVKKGSSAPEDSSEWVFAASGTRHYDRGRILGIDFALPYILVVTSLVEKSAFQSTYSLPGLHHIWDTRPRPLPGHVSPSCLVAASANRALYYIFDTVGQHESRVMCDTSDARELATCLASATLNLNGVDDIMKAIASAPDRPNITAIFNDLTRILETCVPGGRTRVSTHLPMQLAGLRLYYRLCRAVPGQEASADVAFKALLGLYITTTSYRMLDIVQGRPVLGSALWHYVGFVSWHVELLDQLVRAAAPGADRPQLCLLATVPAVSTILRRSVQQLAKLRSSIPSKQGPPAPAVEADVARAAVDDAYSRGIVQLEDAVRALEKIRSQQPTDETASSDWLCGLVASQSPAAVEAASLQLREAMADAKLRPNQTSSGPQGDVDLLTRCAIPPTTPASAVKVCICCGSKAVKQPWQRVPGHPGRFEACAAEFARVCLCGSLWVSSR